MKTFNKSFIRRLKYFVILFTIFFPLYAFSNNDNDYFMNLHKELHTVEKNKVQVENIVKRENQKYLETNEKKYLLSYKYSKLFTYKVGDLNQLSGNYEILIKNNNEYNFLTVISNYNLAFLLSNYSPDLCLKYLDDGITAINGDEGNEFLPHFYHFKGYMYFSKNDFRNAKLYYNKALSIFIKTKNDYYIASMHNNFAKIYIEQKNYHNAILEMQYAVKVLNKSKSIPEVLDFLYELKYNLGHYYLLNGDYENSKIILEDCFNYFKNKNSEYAYRNIDIVSDLFEIYIKNKENDKIEKLVDIIKNLEKKISIYSLKIDANEFILKYFLYKNNIIEIKKYYKKIYDLNKIYNDEQEAIHQKTSSILNKKIVEDIDRKYQYEKDIDRKKNLLLLSTTLLVSLFFISLFLIQRKKTKRDKLILENEKTIAEQNKIIAEQDLLLKEEKIKHLHLNLNLKNQTEKAFLQKIKTIRKTQKNADEVLKDLYLNVHNLIEIDKKNKSYTEASYEQNKILVEKLKLEFPNLNNKDIELCIYIKLGLSPKEIAILEKTTNGYIRVRKNKLKSKLNLSTKDNLNEFLQNI